MKIIGNRVLIKQEIPDNDNNIVIPDMYNLDPNIGIIKAVGSILNAKSGVTMPLSVKIGDRVLYSGFGYNIMNIDGEDLLLMKEDEIYGILND